MGDSQAIDGFPELHKELAQWSERMSMYYAALADYHAKKAACPMGDIPLPVIPPRPDQAA